MFFYLRLSDALCVMTSRPLQDHARKLSSLARKQSVVEPIGVKQHYQKIKDFWTAPVIKFYCRIVSILQ